LIVNDFSFSKSNDFSDEGAAAAVATADGDEHAVVVVVVVDDPAVADVKPPVVPGCHSFHSWYSMIEKKISFQVL